MIINDYDDVLEEVKYFSEYSKRFNCQCCGASFFSDVCNYCGNKISDQTLIDESEKFHDKMNEIINSLPQEIYYNDTLNYIYKMRGFSFINQYLYKIKYEDILNQECIKLSKKIDNDENLDIEETKKFEFITLNMFDRKELKSYNKYVLRKVITGKINFSYEYFELYMLDFIFTAMKESGVKGIASIENLEGHYGVVINSFFLKIDRAIIKELYKNKDLEAMITLYHEIRHLVQEEAYKDDKHPNIYFFQMLKERILSKFYYEDYYKKNYSKVLQELDAEEVGLKSMKKIVEYIGLDMPQKIIENFNDDIQSIRERAKDQVREFKGEVKTVDEIFDEFISDKPQLLEIYPYLQYQYKKDNEATVIKKTPMEVLDMIKKIDFSNLNEASKEEIDFFFKILSTPNLTIKKEPVFQDTGPSKKV